MAAQAKIETIFYKGVEVKTPIRLDSIREAADIWQDASLVLGLSLGPMDNPNKEKNRKSKDTGDELIMEVSILKNRNGRDGIKLNYPFNGPVFKLMNTYY